MRDSNSRPPGPKPGTLAIWANPRYIRWCQRVELNYRHKAFQASALPLSYSGIFCIEILVGLGGLEPPTSSLSETRSNQLSYMPIQKLSEKICKRNFVYKNEVQIQVFFRLFLLIILFKHNIVDVLRKSNLSNMLVDCSQNLLFFFEDCYFDVLLRGFEKKFIKFYIPI